MAFWGYSRLLWPSRPDLSSSDRVPVSSRIAAATSRARSSRSSLSAMPLPLAYRFVAPPPYAAAASYAARWDKPRDYEYREKPRVVDGTRTGDTRRVHWADPTVFGNVSARLTARSDKYRQDDADHWRETLRVASWKRQYEKAEAQRCLREDLVRRERVKQRDHHRSCRSDRTSSGMTFSEWDDAYGSRNSYRRSSSSSRSARYEHDGYNDVYGHGYGHGYGRGYDDAGPISSNTNTSRQLRPVDVQATAPGMAARRRSAGRQTLCEMDEVDRRARKHESRRRRYDDCYW